MKLQNLFETKAKVKPGKKLAVAGWEVADKVNAQLKVTWEDAGVEVSKDKRPRTEFWPAWRSTIREQERVEYGDGTHRYTATAALVLADEIELKKVGLERVVAERAMMEFLRDHNEIHPGEPIKITPKHPQDPRIAFKYGEYYYMPEGNRIEIYTKKKFWKLIGKTD